ncbi:MAG: M4 family metallopeptidase [Bacteroidales bacterium]|nr:M4 family metallopeptidase [Bacteroidales bacterium]
MKNCHHPVHCILPPYMVEELATNGNVRQQQQAQKLMEQAKEIRTHRANPDDIPLIAEPAADVRKNRLIYDAGFQNSLPGKLIQKEGEPAPSDVSVAEAYEGSGKTFDLFYDVYGRNSIDNNGMDLISTVHYGKSFDNAFWNGEQMIYGDGDEDLPEEEQLFNRFTISLDVIGHELTHGITQYEARLEYYQQPGALNESFSDVFGVLVKQYALHQTVEEADWIIGMGLFTKNVSGEGIRSMKDPGTAYNDPILGKDPQPGHMNGYVQTTSDNGGVHINSGIPNKAFYICAMELGGYAWEKAGKIWYHALKNKLTPTSDFQETAQSLYLSARELFGVDSHEQAAVIKGWASVGIYIEEDFSVC